MVWKNEKMNVSQSPEGVGSSSLDMLEAFICVLKFFDEKNFPFFFDENFLVEQKNLCKNFVFRFFFESQNFYNDFFVRPKFFVEKKVEEKNSSKIFKTHINASNISKDELPTPSGG